MATDETASVARLRGLIDVTRMIRGDQELPSLLEAIGRTTASSLGYRTVAISLYRYAWDDFCITSVHGNERAREALLGVARNHADFEPLLDERFLRRGAYFVPHGEVDWRQVGRPRYTPELAAVQNGDAWHADDALLVPMRHTDGHLLGIVSVDEPANGRRPTDEELDVLVAVGDHAAIAVQSALEAGHDLRHGLALAQLLSVSSWLAAASSIDLILPAVCHAIRDALGFLNVSIELADALTGRLATRATVGSAAPALGLSVTGIAPLLEPRYEIEGCYLIPTEAVPPKSSHSTRNGRGPWAWREHWLVVPLYDRGGSLVGVIQADDPEDRLLPDQGRLQALRVFANQTTAAILSAAQVQELRFLADHDPLTRLLNRRAFIRQLDAEVAGVERHERTFSLVICDLDGFKALNDRWGHAAGDDALKVLGRVLGEALRNSDGAFRIGGDEFALVLTEATADDAGKVVARASELLAEFPDERFSGLRASFGVATCPEHARDAQTLFRLADEALYRAKRSGDSIRVSI